MPSGTVDLSPESGKVQSLHGRELRSWDQVQTLVLPLSSSVTLDMVLSGPIPWDSDGRRQVLKEWRCGNPDQGSHPGA